MQFFILILSICLFIFLYCVYILANDDFIFLRRDVTMEKLFNIIFLGSLISLFTARLFYGFYAKDIFSNPLTFILFPYFPGLSLLGGVVGAGAYALSLIRHRENPLPVGRICDFFSIAFLIALPIGFVGYYLCSEENAVFVRLSIQAISYFILFIIFLKFFLPRLLTGKFKEGTIAFLFLISFSVVSLVANIFLNLNVAEYFKNFENTILLLMFFSAVGMLIWHERLFLKIKLFKKGK